MDKTGDWTGDRTGAGLAIRSFRPGDLTAINEIYNCYEGVPLDASTRQNPREPH